MEENVAAAKKTVELAQDDLLTFIKSADPTNCGIYERLAKFRDACVHLIFLDWQAAVSQKTETHLWNGHVRINMMFRPFLARFREGDGAKKHVERRKAEKVYLDFIKSSMRFYRGFVQRLASHFDDVPEVFAVVRKFGLDTLSADAPVSVDDNLKRMIVRSCYAALICLGDLSRYRETELSQKERNWGPAKGYYDLAATIDASDGQPWNQLAVIAVTDNDHLSAVYYFYRALSTQKPPPLTLGNLDLEFKKVLKTHERDKPLMEADPTGVLANLVSSFLCHHARYFAHTRVTDLEEQEQQVALTADFASSLTVNASDSAYRKMCLINMAASKRAETHVREVVQKDQQDAVKVTKIYRRTQALNVRSFTKLFKLFTEDLRPREVDSVTASPLLRGLLPLLRLYSCWLLSDLPQLLEISDPDRFGWELPTLWKVYTEALNILIAKFAVLELPDTPYLLSEDQDAIAFTPFTEAARKLHFEGPDGSLKPNRTDCSNTEHLSPDQEMLCRVKGLVLVAAHLFQHRHEFGDISVPIVFAGKAFHYVDDDVASSGVSGSMESNTHANDVEIQKPGQMQLPPSATEKMVIDSLVDPSVEPLRDSPSSQSQSPSVKHVTRSTASRPTSSTYTVSDLVRQMQQPSPVIMQRAMDQSPTNHTSFPGIYHAPLTSRETISSSASNSRPGTAHHVPLPNATGTPSLPSTRDANANQFNQQISNVQHNSAARTSPITASFDPSLHSYSTYYETPTGLHTFVRNHSQSPWDTSLATPSAHPGEGSLERISPQPSPFGAIGESRPKSAKTPTSARRG